MIPEKQREIFYGFWIEGSVFDIYFHGLRINNYYIRKHCCPTKIINIWLKPFAVVNHR